MLRYKNPARPFLLAAVSVKPLVSSDMYIHSCYDRRRQHHTYEVPPTVRSPFPDVTFPSRREQYYGVVARKCQRTLEHEVVLPRQAYI